MHVELFVGGQLLPQMLYRLSTPLCVVLEAGFAQPRQQQGSDPAEGINPTHEIVKLLSTGMGRTYFSLENFPLYFSCQNSITMSLVCLFVCLA